MHRPRRAGRPRADARPVVGDPTDAILAAASRLIGELGVGGTPMSRIASEVGLKQSSLYYYFRRKEEILAALVARANVVPLELMRTIAGRRRHAPAPSCTGSSGPMRPPCAPCRSTSTTSTASPCGTRSSSPRTGRSGPRSSASWPHHPAGTAEGTLPRRRPAAHRAHRAGQRRGRPELVPHRLQVDARDDRHRTWPTWCCGGLLADARRSQPSRPKRTGWSARATSTRRRVSIVNRNRYRPFAAPKRPGNRRCLRFAPSTGGAPAPPAPGLGRNPMRNGNRRIVTTLTAGVLAAGLLAGCGSSGGSDASGGSDGGSERASSGDTIKIGYSAWPGWFPLTVAEQEKGIFEDAGVDVDLMYFTDYTASLDALAAGKVDVNAQTLNDTMFGVAAGSEQTIVVAGDNSTGNDAIICDESITSVPQDLKGKTDRRRGGRRRPLPPPPGPGRGGHDPGRHRLRRRQDRRRGRRVRRRRVRLRRRVRPLHRPGARARGLPRPLHARRTSPASSPTTSSPTAEPGRGAPEDVPEAGRRPGTPPSTASRTTPTRPTAIMADEGRARAEEYEDFAEGTTLFDAEDALDAFEDRADDPTSLPEMARRINPFLRGVRPRQGGGRRSTGSSPRVHPGLRRRQRVTADATRPATRPDADVVAAIRSPACREGPAPVAARGAGRRSRLLGIRHRDPGRLADRLSASSASASCSLALWFWSARGDRLGADPHARGRRWSAFAGMVSRRHLPDRPVGVGPTGGDRLRDLDADRRRARRRHRARSPRSRRSSSR